MTETGTNRVLVLYVEGTRDRSGPQWDSLESTGVRLASTVIPARVLGPGRSPAAGRAGDPNRMEIPYDQAQCVRLVNDVATRMGYAVKIVDVANPQVSREDVERAIGLGGSFPVLVRPDGAWLEGAEYFTPSRVRKFLK